MVEFSPAFLSFVRFLSLSLLTEKNFSFMVSRFIGVPGIESPSILVFWPVCQNDHDLDTVKTRE